MFENQTDNQHSDQHFFLLGFIIEEMQPNYPAYLKKLVLSLRRLPQVKSVFSVHTSMA